MPIDGIVSIAFLALWTKVPAFDNDDDKIGAHATNRWYSIKRVCQPEQSSSVFEDIHRWGSGTRFAFAVARSLSCALVRRSLL